MTQRRKSKKRSKSKSPLQPEQDSVKKVRSNSDSHIAIDLDTILDDSESESRISNLTLGLDEMESEMESENTAAKTVAAVSPVSSTSMTTTTITTTLTTFSTDVSTTSLSSITSASIGQNILPPPPPPVIPAGIVGNFEGQQGSPPNPMAYYQGSMMTYPGLGQSLSGSPIMTYPGMTPSLSLSISDDDVTRIAIKLKSMILAELQETIETLINLKVTEKVAEEIAPLKEEIRDLRQFKSETINEVVALKMRVDDQEQYSRRMCIRIAGIDEREEEDTNKLVLDLAAQMSVRLRPEDIDRSHRVGKVRSGRNQRSRELIVKFTNYSARLNFIKGRKQLRETRASVYISEDLTKERKNIFYECRQAVKAKVIKTTFSMDGNIFIIDNLDKKFRIRSTSDIAQYQSQIPPPQVPPPPPGHSVRSHEAETR